MNAYAQFFLPREVRWSWQTFGMHSDELELLLLNQCEPIQATGCWEWSGSRFDAGYGRLSIDCLQFYAHRISQVLWNGPLTSARPHALHSCDNPPCINPSHLRAGTHKENMADRDARGRAFHQRQDFEYVNSKLTDEALERLIDLREAGASQASIAAALDVHPATVGHVLTGRSHVQRLYRLRAARSA